MTEQITNKNVYNKNGERHGYWVVYWFNGELWRKGNYANGKRHGYWEEYYPNGIKKYEAYFL